jgi:hypothetical protein
MPVPNSWPDCEFLDGSPAEVAQGLMEKLRAVGESAQRSYHVPERTSVELDARKRWEAGKIQVRQSDRVK